MKKYLALVLALCCAVMTGCAGILPVQTEPEIETTAPTEWIIEAPVYEKIYENSELTFRSIREADSAEGKILTQAAEVFEARTGAKVRIIWAGEEAEPADILQLPDAELEFYAEQLLDLTDLAAEADYIAKSRPDLLERVFVRCDSLKAIPQTPYVEGFYYNTEAFGASGVVQAPEDWDRFRSVYTLLKSAGYQPLTLEEADADDVLLLFLTQHLGADEVVRLCAEGGWRSEQVETLVTEVFDLMGGANLVNGTNRVATSNSAVAFGTNALCAQGEAIAMAELSWGMFPYPGIGEAEPFVTMTSDVLAVSDDCANPRAAFGFILLLTTGEFDQLRADVTLGVPADPANQSPILGMDEVLDRVAVITKPAASLTPRQQGYIQNFFRGRYKDVATLLKELDAHY